MAGKRDYYEVLGVDRNASPEDLRGAYRNLAKQYHPDVNKEQGAEERFKEINEAYAVLSDAERKSAYDRFGHAGVRGPGGATDFTVDFSDFADIFGEVFQQTRNNIPTRSVMLQFPAVDL